MRLFVTVTNAVFYHYKWNSEQAKNEILGRQKQVLCEGNTGTAQKMATNIVGPIYLELTWNFIF